jgi:hypothetical protein
MDGFQFTKQLCKQIIFTLKHFRVRLSDSQNTWRKGSCKLGNLKGVHVMNGNNLIGVTKHDVTFRPVM